MLIPTLTDLENIFQVANLSVLPFWALMVLLPNWSVTQRVMQSYIPFAALASLYVYLFVTLDGGILEAFSDPQLKLTGLAGMFANAQVMALGWVHFLVMDLFVGDGFTCKAKKRASSPGILWLCAYLRGLWGY